MPVGARMLVAVVWVIALAWLSAWSNTDAAMVLALLATLAAAALVNSWWLLLVPVPPALLMIAASLASGSELDGDGISGWDWAGVIAVVTLGLVVLLGIGVGVGRLARRLIAAARRSAPAR